MVYYDQGANARKATQGILITSLCDARFFYYNGPRATRTNETQTWSRDCKAVIEEAKMMLLTEPYTLDSCHL